ncbi:MAG: hypothetical protein RMY62_016260 [Nostoc sp. ZfuVER08]|jgi:hypothetical protein|uniref:Uncharacterized protein n=1 Tax=Nostoc punctiforme FACHB-252 TaxID=1357509 RepID=A0ABR8H9Z6_NOSPU|nr:hypothetical protein [Nostoc punctiforme]MBD2612558.1 hypothetical protein [Nostoc punctiforme FACHB-252]MDZ8012707.1 hypothetical protein [Nostoc sp. ZfuVER08]
MTKPRQELRNLLQTAQTTSVSAFLSAIRIISSPTQNLSGGLSWVLGIR